MSNKVKEIKDNALIEITIEAREIITFFVADNNSFTRIKLPKSNIKSLTPFRLFNPLDHKTK